MRADITYLSRRRKPATVPNPVRAEPVQADVPQGGTATARTAQPSAGVPLDLSRRQPSAAQPSGPSLGLTLDGGPSAGRTAAPAASAAPAAAARPTGSSTGLTLGGRSASTPAPSPASGSPAGAAARSAAAGHKKSVATKLFPAPAFGSIRELGAENPVVRLNARQSAIGSLLVVGARSVAWEDQHFISGAQQADGQKAGAPVSTPGNRPLVGIADGAGIVSLRHGALLRRALFIAGDRSQTLGVFDGAAAGVAARNAAGQRSVLYVTRIAEIFEIRAEFVPADAPDEAIWAMFGFAMTLTLDQRVRLR